MIIDVESEVRVARERYQPEAVTLARGHRDDTQLRIRCHRGTTFAIDQRRIRPSPVPDNIVSIQTSLMESQSAHGKVGPFFDET